MSRPDQVSSRVRIQSSNPVQHNERQASFIDWWVSLRENLINRLSGIKEDEVLNVVTAGPIPHFGKGPAADLKRTLDKIKIAAIDESGARVDYAALRDSPAYLHYRNALAPSLKSFDPLVLESRQQRLAFWINLYNALVMDAIIALEVQRSVIEGKLGLLTFFRRTAYNVGGYRISLDEIENGVLRGNRGHPFLPGKQFATGDPRMDWVIWPPDRRIHFALNCASRSCPPIQVYSAENLEAQLDLAARNFVGADVILDPAQQMLAVSSIFQWYKGDFGGQGGIISFVTHHLPYDGRRAWLTKYKDIIRLRYKPYDWRLNAI